MTGSKPFHSIADLLPEYEVGDIFRAMKKQGFYFRNELGEYELVRWEEKKHANYALLGNVLEILVEGISLPEEEQNLYFTNHIIGPSLLYDVGWFDKSLKIEKFQKGPYKMKPLTEKLLVDKYGEAEINALKSGDESIAEDIVTDLELINYKIDAKTLLSWFKL